MNQHVLLLNVLKEYDESEERRDSSLTRECGTMGEQRMMMHAPHAGMSSFANPESSWQLFRQAPRQFWQRCPHWKAVPHEICW